MTPAEVLIDALTRTAEGVAELLDGISEEELAHRPAPDANPIAWLLWHLTRVQDSHLAEVAGRDQVWVSDGFAGRFALPLDVTDTGYGHSADQVATVVAPAALLQQYSAAVHTRSVGWISELTPDDLDRVVDDRWDPPVTLGVRLVSVADDCAQHLGQASYVKGLLG
jgi:hypothetical protein